MINSTGYFKPIIEIIHRSFTIEPDHGENGNLVASIKVSATWATAIGLRKIPEK